MILQTILFTFMLERSWFKYGLNLTNNMKKVLKFFMQSNMILLCSFILYTSCGSSEPKKCDVPSAKFGTLKIEAMLYTGSLLSYECPRPNNVVLLDNLTSMGSNAYVKEKADDATKYAIEVIINGGCSDGIWTKIFKKGEFTLTNVGANKVRFTIPDIPLSSTNEYTIIPRILTPCVGSNFTCNGKTNYRVVVGGNTAGFKASNPTPNGLVEIRTLKTDNTLGNFVEFVGTTEEDCQ
jgi:hypothetical protein